MTQNIPAASPPTAEQVERATKLLNDLRNTEKTPERVWRCYDREMGRNEWIADQQLVAIRRLLPDEWVITEFTAAPTRAGALDAAGTKVAKLEATLRTISSLPRDSFDRAKYLADAAFAAGDGSNK